MGVIIIHIDHQRLVRVSGRVHHLNNTFDPSLAHAGKIVPKIFKNPCHEPQRDRKTQRNMSWTITRPGVTSIHIDVDPAGGASARAQGNQQYAQQ
jgi:hypothetical protein